MKRNSLKSWPVGIVFLMSSGGSAKDINTLWSDLRPVNKTERIVYATSFFVGFPSGLDPLGEGEGIDPDPLISYKKFDCTTYVETVLAMAFAENESQMQQKLNDIRYANGRPDFFERNHFMVTDWIPANSKKGYISSLTEKLSLDKAAYRTDKRVLKKTIWFYHRVIDLMDKKGAKPKDILNQLSKVPLQNAKNDEATYLIASNFRANEAAYKEKLPDVSIVMFVRNILNIPTLVSHMGFLIQKNGKLYLNHAPQAKPWKIQEQLLEDYFKDMDAHRAPIEGLIIFKIGQ